MSWKYFKDSEVEGLNDDFVRKLEKARAIAMVPFRITSGLRNASQNESIPWAVSDSSHLSGTAADLACSESSKRYKIVKALLKVGFTRIGIYDKHVHCDVDESKDQKVIWVGESH